MAINVICPGCHTAFKVNDKFAGQEGPCPKCKVKIKIPEKSDELVIHTPEEYEGVKDSTGKSVLRPLRRKDAKISPQAIVFTVAGCLMLLLVAWLVGRAYREEGVEIPQIPLFLKGAGAFLVAPLLAFGGYTFLRDPELAPHRGFDLWVRVAICGIAYAVLWGVFAVVSHVLFDSRPEIWNLVYVVPFMFIAGAVAAHVTFELEFTTGLFHYGLYILATVALRLVAGLRPF